ncbi:hypothetical protein cypCar_00015592 [Cyprinus carpio]|nr:hypothetical protein cypCar_00015592 [Cyprinus carpio]
MMRIILLLLVTLTGPFCTFTQASTLVVPTAIGSTPQPNLASDSPTFTYTTEVTSPQDAVSTSEPAPEVTEAAATTEEVPMVSTTAPVIQSEAPFETTALTDTTQSTEAVPIETTSPEATTVFAEAEMPEKVEDIESKTADEEVEDEGMGTGQLVGIVIGALITVIVVIAVIILLVRRMGQYSTAKKRKPQKQKSILISVTVLLFH